jgi:hypothetical protein
MLVLFICFRNEPAVKATSVSLSMLIFTGCYLVILYLYVINSFLLPSFHEQGKGVRDFMCGLRTSLNGVGFPVALIQSTVLVKLLRVYRLFKLRRRVSKITTSNTTLALCVLLVAAPNLLLCLLWCFGDPYTSAVSFSIKKGLLKITVRCVSEHTLRWAALLLAYVIILSLILLTFAILTRNIKYRDFKDTKKIGVLSFLLVFNGTYALFYWFFFQIIGADVVLVAAVLHVGNYCMILECQGLLFAPKLFPIAKEILLRRLCSRGSEIQTTATNVH